MELAPEVGLGDFQIPKSHSDVLVTHQLHESGEAHSAEEHFRGPGVTKAMRRYRTGVGTTRAFCEIRHRFAQRLKQGKSAANARQEEAV